MVIYYMMYQIKITAQAKKELKNIKKEYYEGINLSFEEIKENPFIGKPLLRELFGKYSYRVGQYRIVYIIDKKDKIVKVLTAGHRSSVYI